MVGMLIAVMLIKVANEKIIQKKTSSTLGNAHLVREELFYFCLISPADRPDMTSAVTGRALFVLLQLMMNNYTCICASDNKKISFLL